MTAITNEDAKVLAAWARETKNGMVALRTEDILSAYKKAVATLEQDKADLQEQVDFLEKRMIGGLAPALQKLRIQQQNRRATARQLKVE